MAIRFANGFGIGAANNGGGGGGGPVINCNPTASLLGTLYYDSGTTATWTDDTSGYTLYNGSYTSNDDGWSTNPVTLPTPFFMACTGSTKLFISTNGYVTFENGNSAWDANGPQNYSYNPPIYGNQGDLWLENGVALSDGTQHGAWYKITSNSNYLKIELKVFQGHFGNLPEPNSYQMNLYRDSTYQYAEIYIKSNQGQSGNKIGPYSSSDVSQVSSTTSKVWRSDLSGTNWQYMGEGSVSLTAPPLTQFSNNGSTNNQGLILSLDGSVAISGSTLLDQSGNSNNLTLSGGLANTSGYYDFGSNVFATTNSNTLYNNILNTMSVTMWVNFNSLSSGTGIIAKTNGNSAGWALRYDTGNLNLVKYNIADQRSTETFTMNTNTWYHIGVVQGGTSLLFMLNGVIIGSTNGGASDNLSTSGSTFRIARDEYVGSYASMKLAKLKIWDTFKTSSDILTEFNNEKTSYGY